MLSCIVLEHHNENMKTSIRILPLCSSMQRVTLLRAEERLLNHCPLFDLLLWELVPRMLCGIFSTELPICAVYSVYVAEYELIFTHENLYKNTTPSTVGSHFQHAPLRGVWRPGKPEKSCRAVPKGKGVAWGHSSGKEEEDFSSQLGLISEGS